MQICRVQDFNLLADLFSQPDAVQLERIRLQADALIQADSPDGDTLHTLIQLVRQGEFPEQRIAEYNRLFVLGQGSVPAPLFASYWLEPDHLLLGKSIRPVVALLERHGIVVDPASGLTPDHLISELEFAAFLCEQGLLAGLEQLIADHMQLWIPLFLQTLRSAEPSDFYRLSADLLERVVARFSSQATHPDVGQASLKPLAGESHVFVAGT
jgi:TorA maturation chaperone TorD